MDDLVTFLRARLDEEEHLARKAGETDTGTVATWTTPCNAVDNNYTHNGPCRCCRVEGPNITLYDEGGHDRTQAHHIATWDPARVLTELHTKRGFVASYTEARRSYTWWKAHHDPEHPATEKGLAVASASLSEWIVVIHTLAAIYSTHPDYPTTEGDHDRPENQTHRSDRR